MDNFYMTEPEWVSECDVCSLLDSLKHQKSSDPRRLRLFGCACCRRVWQQLTMKAVCQAVEAAEAFADEKLSEAELMVVGNENAFEDFESRRIRPTESGSQLSMLTYNLILAARWLTFAHFDFSTATRVSCLTAGEQGDDFFYDPERDLLSSDILPSKQKTTDQARILRDIFSNPFHPITFNPLWRTETTIALAQGAYEERFLPSGELDVARLMILADALEEAGCDNEEILSHLRSPGPHVRGCWALDLVLGKT